MPTKQNEFQSQFLKKFHEFELFGLEQYAKYLKQQKKLSAKQDHMETYGKYIDKEILRNDKKIMSVKGKL